MTRPVFGEGKRYHVGGLVDIPSAPSNVPDEPEPPAKTCDVCCCELEWVDCYHCGGEGYADEFHDCGEDTCCCLHPEPGECPECHGEGGCLQCPNAEHHEIRRV